MAFEVGLPTQKFYFMRFMQMPEEQIKDFQCPIFPHLIH